MSLACQLLHSSLPSALTIISCTWTGSRLQTHGVVHLDIKPSNIVRVLKGGDSDRSSAKSRAWQTPNPSSLRGGRWQWKLTDLAALLNVRSCRCSFFMTCVVLDYNLWLASATQKQSSRGRETQKCPRFWTRLLYSRLKIVNSHRDRAGRRHRDRGVVVAKCRTVLAVGLACCPRASKLSTVPAEMRK